MAKNDYDWLPCYWCREGKYETYIPSTYDNSSNYTIRAVCDKSECQTLEKEQKESERKNQENINNIYNKYNKSKKEIDDLEEQIKKNANQKLNEEAKKLNKKWTCLKCQKLIPLTESDYRHKDQSPYCKLCVTELIIQDYNNKQSQRCDDCFKDISNEKQYHKDESRTGNLICQTCAIKRIQNNNSPSPSSPPNNTSFSQEISNVGFKCCECKKYIDSGKIVNYHPQNPNEKWCFGCDHETKECLSIAEKILKGEEIDINKTNVNSKNKTELILLVRLKNGEEVDLDKENLDPGDREKIKKIQGAINSGQIPTNPKPINVPVLKPKSGYKYAVICQDCKKEWSAKGDIPSKCEECSSKNIKVYGTNGQELIIPTKNDNNIPPVLILIFLIGCIISSIFFWRWVKRKRSKTQDIKN